MKTKRGKDRFIALALSNIAIAVFVLILCVGYSQNVRSDKERAARDAFTAAVESTAQLSYGYMSSLQNECDSWAAYIENHGYSAEEAVEYLKEVNINSDVSVHILYYDTLSGLSTGSGNNGNKVDYSQVAESFTYILPLMINGTRGEGTVYISSAYINPVDGINSIGFCSLLTVRDDRGGDAKAILVKTIPVNVLHSQWLFPGAYREAEVSLIDINGRYIIQSGSMSGDTFWTFIKQNNGLSYVDIGRFQSSFQKEDKCLVELKDQAGEDAYYVSSQIENTLNCTFVGYIQSKALVDIGFDWHMLFYVTIGFLLLLLLDGSHIMSINRQLKKSVEETQNANMAKTRFLSSMSHDIRTPMNAIIGMSVIAQSNLNSPDKIQDCLAKINTSSRHLLNLINEVLDMSKIESGKIDLIYEEVSLPKLIEDVMDVFRPLVAEKYQTLQVNANRVRHEHVVTDKGRLQQVLVNLLSNAVKYTPEGGNIGLRIQETPSFAKGKGQYSFVVTDSGIGMHEDFISHVFEPFSRADDARINNIQGTGLGMAITQNIVRMMNGTIEVKSTPGKGSQFVVAVTFDLCSEPETDDGELAGLPVLVADDDQAICESVSEILNELGMQCSWVLSGREAVDRVVKAHEQSDDFFAVILDWIMPDIDGLETLKLIRTRVGPDMPIIIISAYDFSEIEDKFRLAGADAFITKPLFKSKIVYAFQKFRRNDRSESRSAMHTRPNAALNGKKLLLAEDNELNREIAMELLKAHGLLIDTADNGLMAVDRFKTSAPGEYACILMDIQMPVMDGYNATKAIRALEHEDAHTIPILALTANAFASDIGKAHSAGMNDHIAKPIDVELLMETLGRWIG